jgi:hypothetical protein
LNVLSATSIINTYSTFSGATKLLVLDFPVLNYLKGSRLNATGLKAFVLRSTAAVCALIPTETTALMFNNDSCYFYVPKLMDSGVDGIASYEAATNWSALAGRFRYIEDYTVDGTLTGEFDTTKI